MASPQTGNGYTQIANELLDALIKTRIPGEAEQCLKLIIRKTYGYHKKNDKIALSQFAEATGIPKPRICRALNKLKKMNIVIAQKGNKGIISYCLQKNYEKWEPLPKKAMTIAQKGNNRCPKRVPQKIKDNVTKDNKDIYVAFFEKFWEKYPKRDGKKLGKTETFGSIRKNIKQKDFDLFMIALDNYINSENVKNGYPVDPKRFIKNRIWTWRDWIEPVETEKEYDSQKYFK